MYIHTGSGSGVRAETSLKVGSGSEKNHSGSTTLDVEHCLSVVFAILALPTSASKECEEYQI
jgi:hypothetical protein